MKKRATYLFAATFLVCVVLVLVITQHLRHSNSPNTVQADNCAQGGVGNPPIGDVGCYLTVNGKNIYIVHGNTIQPTWGHIEGFTPAQNITGKKVAIKVHQFGGHYAISGSNDYVKLLN